MPVLARCPPTRASHESALTSSPISDFGVREKGATCWLEWLHLSTAVGPYASAAARRPSQVSYPICTALSILMSHMQAERRECLLAPIRPTIAGKSRNSGKSKRMIQEKERKPGRGLPIRYLLVLWILVLSTIAFLDRTNISIAGVQISKEFRIDNSRLGWIFSAFLIGYASFQIPGGVIIRRFGPRRVLTFFVLTWGVFTVLTALVPPGMRGSLWVL